MPVEPQQPVEATLGERPVYSWYHKFGALLFVIFCFEVGVFLLVFPWLDAWDTNSIGLFPGLHSVWENTYFRGALSGLGIVNIYISFLEVFRLRRFASS
jgi:hypothetical protein